MKERFEFQLSNLNKLFLVFSTADYLLEIYLKNLSLVITQNERGLDKIWVEHFNTFN